MKFGVIRLPGSNCDQDCYHIAASVYGIDTDYLWHKDRQQLEEYDLVMIPGGFSYGDYLRTGAIARFSPLMKSVRDYARAGGLVMGICNGFQILTEMGLLPGALMVNDSLQFKCQYVYLRVEERETPYTTLCSKGQILEMPIAHGDGSYYLPLDQLEKLEAEGQVILRYCDQEGKINDEANPNGAVNNIAGICNQERNVFGLMPHPERSGETILGNGSVDGKMIFDSILESRGVKSSG